MPEGRHRGLRGGAGGVSPRALPCGALLAFGLFLAAAAQSRDPVDTPALWQALRDGGLVLLMRHALAPGTGDPAGFRLDDCSTQRNLSDTGRAQARATGQRLRDHGVAAEVYSSQWCRCLETAELLDLGPVRPFPGLNSFFGARAREAEASAATRRLIAGQAGPGRPNLMLVTHQVNITALTGVFPSSGEIVVLRPEGDRLLTLGSLPEIP